MSSVEGHTWGLALVKMALRKGNLTPEQLYLICSKIGEWGILQNTLENMNLNSKNEESALWLLDNLYSVTSDQDILYGFRMQQTNSKVLKNAFTQLQQREYFNALEVLNDFNNSFKRDLDQVYTEEEDKDSLSQRIEKSYVSDIMKECVKELNEWETFLDHRNKSYDT